MNSNGTQSPNTSDINVVSCYFLIFNQISTNLSIYVAFIRFAMVACIVAKISFNLQTLYNKKIFALYFLILFTGSVVDGCSQLYLLSINPLESDSLEKYETVNSIETVGIILMDTFFGLMPNLFYSVYKTNMTKATGHITTRYFVVNGIIMTSFCVICILATSFDKKYQVYSSDTILTVEYLYGLFFYILVMVRLNELEGNIHKVIQRYFLYYCIYGMVLILRNTASMAIVGYVTIPGNQQVWAEFWVSTVYASVQSTVVILYLRDIKLTKDENKSDGSSRSPSTASNQ